jgi:hypothetical protein
MRPNGSMARDAGASLSNVVNAVYSIVGKPCPNGFPIKEVKDYFRGRGDQTELSTWHLKETRLRFILLNLIYVDQMGSSPFDVKFKGNELHVDHIYPPARFTNKTRPRQCRC